VCLAFDPVTEKLAAVAAMVRSHGPPGRRSTRFSMTTR
jgi:hypothetical protein